MSYTLKSSLSHIGILPIKAKKLFIVTYNNAIEKYDSDSAEKIARIALESKYEKSVDDTWIIKSEVSDNLRSFDMYITKAIYKDGEMQWQSTASDTSKDAYDEQMSVDLYKSFIEHLTESKGYLSLSHYPSLDGKAELGLVTELYIDGDKLKAKGTFYNNPLGIAAYNAIKRDRRENTPFENRIRVSISFFDRNHIHKGVGEWNSKSGVPCYMCATGIKNKIYKSGKFEHLAITRVPALRTTDINTTTN